MKFQPDDDFIGYDIQDPDDVSRKQIVVAPPMQGVSLADNKWLLIAAAAIAFLVLTKKKR